MTLLEWIFFVSIVLLLSFFCFTFIKKTVSHCNLHDVWIFFNGASNAFFPKLLHIQKVHWCHLVQSKISWWNKEVLLFPDRRHNFNWEFFSLLRNVHSWAAVILPKQGISVDVSENGLCSSFFFNVKTHSVNKISWYLWLERVLFYYVIECVTDRVIWDFHDKLSVRFCQIWQIQIWVLTLHFCGNLVSNKIHVFQHKSVVFIDKHLYPLCLKKLRKITIYIC